jgi:hypothetical protein
MKTFKIALTSLFLIQIYGEAWGALFSVADNNL